MSEPVNLRVSRSSFSVRSSPTRNMSNAKDKQTPPSKMDTGTGTNTGTGKDGGVGTEKSVLCSMQDIWGFISSLQEMVMKQGEDIKNLALKNQELEHTIQIKNLKMQHQDEKIQALQDAFNKQVSNVQDALATHDEKLAHISDSATGNTTSWAHVVRSTLTAIPQTHETYANVDVTEYNEREKRGMNIVIRGIPESDNEKVLMLNAEVTDLLANTFGMHDVVVYGAHRVGKQRPENNCAIVCTMLDARKRAIILENARIYLRDSPIYISEDRTPAEQKERRQAYEERMKKHTTPTGATPPEA
ncbi:hypothetical protein L7F22_017420 [Adiantum nelumboides]|nr:hypothetical protein [Adiantum nelumboides]